MTTKSMQIHLFDEADFSPAAKLVQVANRYSSSIYLETAAGKVNAKSIMGVMTLAAGMGVTLELETNGEREEEAMRALRKLIERRFDEDE